jgi:hypothetical protein
LENKNKSADECDAYIHEVLKNDILGAKKGGHIHDSRLA